MNVDIIEQLLLTLVTEMEAIVGPLSGHTRDQIGAAGFWACSGPRDDVDGHWHRSALRNDGPQD